MPKAFLFWLIWLLCVISFLGAAVWNWPTIYNGVVVLVLFGLLGWNDFGKPIQ